MSDAHEELLNVYDGRGRPVGTKPRAEAKASGLAVGAVNVLLVNARGEVLLQRRPADKENGGRWDKSVGGHVSAGEELRRDGGARGRRGAVRRSRLARGAAACPRPRPCRVTRPSGPRTVAFFPAVAAARPARRAPRARRRGAKRHLPRRDLPRPHRPAATGFRPQASEIADLDYFPAAQVDRMLLAGQLAPNMAFLWLTHAGRLLDLVRG